MEFENFSIKIPGVKIAKTHFKLGSKIHISDYYYAKKIFQSSFFAARFAMLIAKYFLANINLKDNEDVLDKIKSSGISLVGYGIYSELLVSILEKFIKKSLDLELINHDFIQDSDDLTLIKSPTNILGTVLIIVPIASTFSTSLKMEEAIKSQLNDPSKLFLHPHINVLLVSNGTALEPITHNELTKKFGWHEPDLKNKIIPVESFASEKKPVDQKYFIALPTKWHDITECELCFPINECSIESCVLCKEKKPGCPINESLLFETDKTSVTPTLIFDNPTSRTINKLDQNRCFELEAKHLIYGHRKRGANHYHYYIKIDDFLISNDVDRWLRQEVRPKLQFNTEDSILIISPAHFSNTNFINIVNDELFSNAANIIHYDANKDSIQNFQLFYRDEINGATKIYFVDDTITSGSTFIRMNFFLRNTRQTIDGTGFDALIVLLNRSSYFVNKNIESKLNCSNDSSRKIFSFANLHLPLLKGIDTDCPLCYEMDRYKELISNSLLDRMKIHFLNQSLKINVRDVNSSNNTSFEKHIARLEAVHIIYQWFQNGHKIEDFTFEQWIISLQEIPSPIKKSILFESEKGDGGLGQKVIFEEKMISKFVILKVLTQPPFIYHKTIKNKAFEWVLDQLFQKVIEVYKELKKNTFNTRSYRDLKFILRRASFLHINLIISDIVFEMIEAMFSYTSFLEKDDFKVFYLANVKELTLHNEACSIVLENRLDKLQKTNKGGRDYIQLLRMLREENGLIIEKYWDIIKKDPKLQNLIIEAPASLPSLIDNSFPNEKHYRSLTFGSFSKSFDEKSIFHLKNYLTVRCFLESENTITKTLSEKTRFLFIQLEKFFQTNYIGSFLIIKINQSTNKFVYNVSSKNLFYENQDDVINRFLDGDHLFLGSESKDVSIVEFSRCKEKEDEWENLYYNDKGEKKVRIFVPDEYNRLCLLRINRKEITKSSEYEIITDVPQGVIGFYFNSDYDSLTNVTQTRYLLLLRPYLSQFIKEHHGNNEFRDLLDALNSKRYAMLMGHGREMLLHLSREDEFKNIILDLENLQLIATFRNTVEKVAQHDINQVEYFNMFYNIGDSLTKDTFQKLRLMADKIFKHSWIEDNIDIEIIRDAFIVPDDFSFQFSQRILNLICFELFINAKKNRWNFIDNEVIESDDKNATPSSYSKNYFNFTVQAFKEKLEIKVYNTCPVHSIERSVHYLQIGENPKNTSNNNPDRIAGLTLIQTLLTEKDNGFDLGKIEYHSNKINEKKQFGFFQITLILKKLSKP